MLKQILKDMYVDPEILAELPEEQKQVLFFKIREEQVRRFKEFDKKDDKKALKKKANSIHVAAKRVKINEDKCGDPWTWVMGDFKGDLKVEEKWEKISDGVSLHGVNGSQQIQAPTPPKTPENTSNENKPKTKVPPASPKPPPVAPKNVLPTKSNALPSKPTIPPRNLIPQQRPPLAPSSVPPPPKPEEVEEPSDIYEGMDQIMQMNETRKKTNEEDQQWKQQLNRFKKEDERRRVMARRASMEVLRQSNVDADKIRRMVRLRMKFHKEATTEQKPVLPPKPKNLRPKHPMPIQEMAKPTSKTDAVSWFRDCQLENILQANDGMFPDYLHGIISRQDANDLLEEKTKGDFLVRISDKIWGYALSYKDEDRVKHFLIDASAPSSYHFFGNDQIRHSSLQEVVEFHMEEPISFGNEVLKNAVGQKDSSNPDYRSVLPAGTNNSNETTQF